jgi:hypothetical protein
LFKEKKARNEGKRLQKRDEKKEEAVRLLKRDHCQNKKSRFTGDTIFYDRNEPWQV